jgi:2-polyprenyl-6-methoxyphenol hydroxylase-like FAD-dependent oxidoreductase
MKLAARSGLMPEHLGKLAVVIGGSIAGMTAARVLADYFDQVTVLERDVVELQPVVHKSVPQGNHLHALMLGGQQVLSSLYPGFTDRLLRLGAVRFRFGLEAAFFFPSGRAFTPTGSVRDPRDLGVDGFSQSRGLLEHCIRQCSMEVANLRFEFGAAVQSLVYENGQVCGVRFTRDGVADSLGADLVVDAGGRGSRAPRWLREMGFAEPEETVIGCDFAYTSAKFRKPANYDGVERVMLFGGPPPKYTNGAGIGEIENDTWIVSVAGRFGDYPPSDPDGFMAFSQSLPTGRFYNLIKDAERISPITHHRFPTSVLRHYERLPAFPERFLVLGDAISSFNPVYGQGMSSAARQAAALRGLLAERAAGSNGDGLKRLGAGFFPRAADVVASPWILAAGSDFAYPQTTGERPPNMEEGGRYFAALDSLVAEDVSVHKMVVEVFQLARPLSDLMADPLRSRVMARMAERTGK